MFELGKKGAPVRGQEDTSGEREENRQTAAAAAARPASSAAGKREAAVIGPSIHIDGDLRGEEDLLIEGEVNGTVQLKSNSLTIGANGKVRADVYAHSIFVEGLMEGDLFGSERVAIRKTAEVRGNVTSPRVSLEEGARFKGSIEMDGEAVKAALGSARGASGSSAGSAGSQAARQASASPAAKSDVAGQGAAVKTGATG
jgi:cytoskeletal protein CcmA (bactofilin family)